MSQHQHNTRLNRVSYSSLDRCRLLFPFLPLLLLLLLLSTVRISSQPTTAIPIDDVTINMKATITVTNDQRNSDFTLQYYYPPPPPPETPVTFTVEQISTCDQNLAQAQTLFAEMKYTNAASEIDSCIDLLESAGGPDSSWLHSPYRGWYPLYFTRALIGWKRSTVTGGDRSYLIQAAEDIQRAIAMNPQPEYYGLQSAIAASQRHHVQVFESTLHELTIHLGMIPYLETVCASNGQVGYNCFFHKISEWVEKKMGWDILSQEPRQVFKLWQTKDLENQYSISTLQHIVRCLRSLRFIRSLLPLNSPYRLYSTAHLPHLLSLFLPTDARLHEEVSTYMFGEGDLLRGLSHSMHDMALQLNATLEFDPTEQVVPMHESWTTLLRYGALLLSAGLETHLTNIARRLLSSSVESVATSELIARHCAIDFCGFSAEGQPIAPSTQSIADNCTSAITYAMLSRVFTRCLQHQHVLPTLFQMDADSHRSSLLTSNEFGYNPFHHFVLYGNTDLVDELLHLDRRSSPRVRNSMTHFGLSALHLAAMRGGPHQKTMVKYLRENGVTTNWRDWKQRTALDLACIHGFQWNLDLVPELASSTELNQQSPTAYCEAIRFSSKTPLDLPPSRVPPLSCIQSGGWSSHLIYSPSILPDPYPCHSGISLTPKLSFVSEEDKLKHIEIQRAIRKASATINPDDPITFDRIPPTHFSRLYDPKCDLPIVRPPSSYSEFIGEIVALQRPVLIRGGLSWETLHFAESYHGLQREELLKRYGEVRLRSANIPYADAFGIKSDEVTLAQFIEMMKELSVKDAQLKTPAGMSQWSNASHFLDRPYIFISIPLPDPNTPPSPSSRSSTPSAPSDLLPLFVSPSWFHPPVDDATPPIPTDSPAVELDPTTHTLMTIRKVQFFIGPRFSGAPEHFHRSAMNFQWFGRKHWSIRPPHASAYRKESKIDELAQKARSNEKLSPSSSSTDETLTCIQEAGDIVFVPDFWSHSTVNLEESLGFAAEVLWGPTHFSV